MPNRFWGIIGGDPYFDWKMVYSGKTSYYKPGDNGCFTDGILKKLLTSEQELNAAYPASTISPKEGSEIYVAPDCPYAINDIRNHYKIKRGIDSGVCNVISVLSLNTSWWMSASSAVACLEENTIFFFDYKLYTCPSYVIEYFGFTPKEIKIINDSIIFAKANKPIPEVITKLLKGELKKPYIFAHQLILNNPNPVTEDTLTVFETVAARRDSPKNEEDFLLQLQALNQCDWRKHLGSLCRVCSLLMDITSYSSVINTMRHKKSRIPKAAKAMWEELIHPEKWPVAFQDEEDYNLWLNWFSSYLKIPQKAAKTTLDTLNEKVSGGARSLFKELYNAKVLVVPRTYTDYTQSIQTSL